MNILFGRLPRFSKLGQKFSRSIFGWLLLLCLLSAAPASAQSKTLYWDRYDVTLAIQPDGSLYVIETQTITFTSGTFTFGFATIPLDKTEGIDSISITEGGTVYSESCSQGSYTFCVEPYGNSIDIRWYFPPTGDSTHTYELAYRVRGAVRIYDSGDKLQWIAISGERDFPIEAASVTVSLPPGASFQTIDSAGVRAQWQQNTAGNAVTYTAEETLFGSDTLEIGVEFTHGLVPADKPGWQEEVDGDEFYDLRVRPILNLLFGGLGVAMTLAAPALVYAIWYTRGRDPEIGTVPEYITEPPDDLPPGVIGTLVDEHADMKDVVASLVDLARRGYMEMEEVRTPGLFGLTSQDHRFRQKRAEGDLTKFEKAIYRGVFGRSKERRLSDLRNKFYTHLPKIQEGLYDEVLKRGFFQRNPQSTRNKYVAVGIGLAAAAGFGGIFLAGLAAQYAGGLVCPAVGLFAFGVGLAIAGPRMPAKTRAGAESAKKWLAFKEYLRRIETLTDLKSAGDLFDRYLPYAIAFGLEQSWMSKFSRIETTPIPGWYVPYPIGRYHGQPSGGGVLASPVGAPGGAGGAPSLQGMSSGMMGGLQSISTGLTGMLNSASRTLGSAPQSSGSSGRSGGGGFSSGGFSGGGGGGGGGRGFG